jgi:chromosome segregation ATPase
LQEARVQKAVTDRRADQLENEINDLQSTNMEGEQKYIKLDQERNSLIHQVRDLEQRLEEWTDSGLPARLQRLENELNESTAKLHQESILRGDVESRLQREIADRASEQSDHRRAHAESEVMSSKLAAAQEQITQMAAGDDRKRRLHEDLRTQVQEKASNVDELEGELQNERYRAAQMETENSDLRGTVNDLSNELERTRQTASEKEAHLVMEQNLRNAEQEAHQTYHREQERAASLAIEHQRTMELEFAEAQRALDTSHQYKLESADARYVQLQQEYENMHELLMRVQQENKSLTNRLEDQRTDSTDRMQQLNDALKDADERSHTLMVRHGAELNASKDEVRTLQERLVEFCESAVANHEVMQTQVDRLRVLCGHVKGDCDSLMLSTDSTRSKVESVRQSLEGPLVSFSNENKHRTSRLMEKVQKLQSELEDAKDQVRLFVFIFCCCLLSQMLLFVALSHRLLTSIRFPFQPSQRPQLFLFSFSFTFSSLSQIATLSLQRDTEHGQLIMAQDQVSRLQYDLNGSQRERVGEQAHTKEQLLAAQSETTTARNIIGDLESRLRQAMDQLTNANTQNGILQQECQMTRTSLAEAQERHGQESDTMKELLERTEHQHRRSRTETDGLHAELTAVKKQLQIEGGRSQSFEEERAALEESARSAHARVRDAETRSSDRIKKLKDELHKLHEQLDSTRDLYNKVRDARDQMRDDNQALKLEMETFQRNMQANMHVKGSED